VPHDPLQPEKCAKLLAALAAPERLKIVRLLTAGPQSVTKIVEGADIKPLNVSHHLAVLKSANLIRGNPPRPSRCEALLGVLAAFLILLFTSDLLAMLVATFLVVLVVLVMFTHGVPRLGVSGAYCC
jgi:hypothetical protein